MTDSQPTSMLTAEKQLTPHLLKVLHFAIEQGASDVHLRVGVSPIVRIDGALRSVPGDSIYTIESVQEDAQSTMSRAQAQRYKENREIDFAFTVGDVRLRTNIYVERGTVAAAFRLIPAKVRSIEQLGLPPVILQFTERKQGLLIVTGPTGHGKSSTLAALIEHINGTRSENIITIEDPIEYLFANQKSLIAQREVGSDTESFSAALRGSLRQDPNVILVGEMRDLETMEAALTLAETGHLVFTTLHTNSSAETADRIIDVFPAHQQDQVRSQLASVLLGVVSQRLIPRISGGRVVAAEILIANSAISNVIREGKTYQLTNIIQTGASEGMLSLDSALAGLVNQGEITIDDAQFWAHDRKQLKLNIY